MKVLYFSRDYTTHDYRFLSSLAQTEHEIYYLRLERRGHALDDRALPTRVEQIAWAGGQKPARLSDGFLLLKDLYRVIRRVNPDVIHAGPIQTAAFLVALIGFRRLVSMSWGYDLLRDARRNKWWRWATQFTLRKSAALVVDCETVRREAERYGMKPDHILSFPWGVDLEHFKPKETSTLADDKEAPFTLLSTRSWEPLYGVDIVARAFVLAAQVYPQLRLVMTGNGSLAGELRRIFQSTELLERVSFPGQIRQADLPRFYQNADLYVSASHVDGASVSLLEAMACGCPVIVSDIPGNLEWVTPGVHGWIFPDGDVRALAQGIIEAVQKRERMPEMGRACRALAEARANWRENFPKLLQAYQLALRVG